MRFAWILLLFAALLPARFGWSASGGDCCAEACLCALPSPESPSCCETAEGPVIVALCGCGEPHTPRLFERTPCDWFTGLPAPSPFSRAETGWLDEDGLAAPRSLRLAPEPPPPRTV